MQKHITFFIALFISFSSLAQVNLDSLWTVWNDSSQADTSRLKAMYKIIWDGYLFSQPDSAFYFAQLQYDFAESVNNKKWIGNATNTQGASFYVRGQYDQAIDYFKKTLRLGDKDGIAAANNNIGLIHNYRGNYKN